MPKASFGECLHRARVEQSLPLREVARRVGLDPSRLFRIEHGDRPPPALPQIRALSRVLGVPMADLLVAAGTQKEVLETLLWSERLSFRKEEAFVPFHPELWEKNTFSAEVMGGRGALRLVRVGEVPIEVIAFSQAKYLRIVIPPEAVLLFSRRPQGLATRNVFPGRVYKVRALGELLNVVLACPGFELNALAPEWAKELPIALGKETWAAIPAPSVRTYPLKEGES